MAVWPNGLRTKPDFTSLWLGYPGHHGLDMINFDTNCAVMGGTVLWAGYQSTGGGYVVGVLADNGDYHRYLHNKRGLLVRRGQRVRTGQALAYQGTSGFSTGKHLHFAVRKGGRWGRYINPLPYLEALVGSTPAGNKPTPIVTEEEEDDMKIIYRHARNPKTGKLEYGIFGQTLSGGYRVSTHAPTGEAWGQMFGKPDGDSWGFVEWDKWQGMQRESAAINADWVSQLHGKV